MGAITPWTPEEEVMIVSGVSPREIATITGRDITQIHSKRTRMGRSRYIPNRRVIIQGNSITHKGYDGPQGWTPEQRAPCRVCGYHEAKTIQLDDGREKLREECLYCHARQVWAAHEGGGAPTVMEVENYDFSEPMITDYV